MFVDIKEFRINNLKTQLDETNIKIKTKKIS